MITGHEFILIILKLEIFQQWVINWEETVPRRFGMLRRSNCLARCKGLPGNHRGLPAQTFTEIWQDPFLLSSASQNGMRPYVIIDHLGGYYHLSPLNL
ncbi:hypothetical protein TNCT_451111 [Trichonephila clavata]|uniref:Uncharacterized protein n=1 Tax=Trichonephila clavata TaxID=2740835 RepID=A0A8X6GS85_TRICU|nr:hypothetical protein TNCT_297231 [Trichonephila clavata]GFR26635.1 hypothetical protein TNCT_451111 [Trichonephila clavata]